MKYTYSYRDRAICRLWPSVALRVFVVLTNFTESVAELVDYGKSMKFYFPHIKGSRDFKGTEISVPLSLESLWYG